jgi:hypothetical protein
MAEVEVLKFTFREVATALVKQANLHEGLWTVAFEFGLGALNLQAEDQPTLPAALVPLRSVALKRSESLNDLTVNAAEVNPDPAPKK